MCGGGTPGPIPNPEAKPASADGTWGTRPWESRSSPRDFCLTRRGDIHVALVLFMEVASLNTAVIVYTHEETVLVSTLD